MVDDVGHVFVCLRGDLMKEKDTKVVLKDSEVDRIKKYIQEADNQLKNLNSTFLQVEQRRTPQKVYGFLKGVRVILKRIDVKSGLNLLKIILWIVMAWTIAELSGDISAKVIGALPFFMGLVVDMMMLRKQLPQDGYTVLRMFAGGLVLFFGGIIVILIACLMTVSTGGTIDVCLEPFMNRALYVGGVLSTFLEFVNSIAIDD